MRFRLWGLDFFGGGQQNEVAVGPNGELYTLQERRTRFDPEFHPFLNVTSGINMNVNAAFGGTPDRIHDGIDTSTLYTASAVIGTKFDFSKDDTHAQQGIVTVIQFGNLSLETITVGVDGSDTVKTEGTDWDATGSNGTTATNIATAISTISGVSATATSAVVTVLADVGSDITKIDTNSAAGDLTATGQSVETNNPAVGDVMQFAKGSDITMANFTAISLQIFVVSDWAEGDSVEVVAYDTDLSAEVGTAIPLEAFFNFGDFNSWHAIAIPLTILDIEATTIVDAFRIRIVSKEGAKSPLFYIDKFQIEQTGTPITFVATTPVNTTFHITEIRLALADDVTSTVANGTMEGLSFDKILGVAKLANGITFRRIENRQVNFSVTFVQLGDFLATGSNLINHISDGTNTFITLLIEFPEPIILTGNPAENFLAFTISDDLSGLLRFTAAARGAVEIND